MKTIKIISNQLLAIASIIAIFSACSNPKGKTETIQEEKTPIIKTETAFRDTINISQEFPATLFPTREANLGSSLPGKIEKFYFTEGSRVKKDDLLVDLSAEVYTQAVIEMNAIEKDYNRVMRLKEKGSISELEYDHIKAKLDASKVKTEMLRKSTQVKAPFSGIIVDYLMEEGENYFFNIALEPGYSNTSGILRLMQLNPLKAEIQVNEKEINKLRNGQIVQLKADALPGEIIQGRIKFIKPMLSAMTHTGTVEIEIPNPQLKLKPGMFATCEISMGEQDGVFVPINSIIRQAGTAEDFVYVIKDNVAKKQIIHRLETRGELVMVDSISAGDQVATMGKNNIFNNTKVEIKN